ncbi:hypothetical protein [Rhizobium ruizarguesonis]|uniref:hypothetical protein n=1 Tax=Rhizobium ruizarguesonis TaxID=2081791 RepID=UPI0004181A7F|nr:hypothetical protein [Rhizobium ruizarguesonis]QJS27482.1 hypothetical protein RLTA1_09365 [Rhizobium leguminosarum bv. trifolii TA1]UFW96236.1 hypothetical protein RlegTA1_09330 [Rhizobium ruizarguesonis]
MILEILNWLAYAMDSVPRRLFRLFVPETVRPGDYHWSKSETLFQPKVRLIDGGWSGNGTLWRRRRRSDDQWEYAEDPETIEEQMDRII